mgnify:CR=1 FL=1
MRLSTNCRSCHHNIAQPATIKTNQCSPGNAIAHQLSVGFVPVRKKGKLPGAVISDAPEAFLAAFATHPDWGFLSLSLYNDDPGVVALNDEYFGLDAKLMAGEISVSETQVKFELTHSDGTPLARGQIARRKSPELASIWRLARLMGWRAFLAAGRAPFAAAHVINRKGSVLQTNRRALTLTSADERAVMRWQAKRDQMTLALPHDFQPKAMQHLNPFRFAYLHPDVAG